MGFHQMVSSLFRDHGMVIFVFGICNKVLPLDDSLVTLKMFCLLPSLGIIDRLSQHLVTRPSSCGIPLDNTNTPLLKTDTMTGCHAFSSHQTPTHQSSFHVAGTRSSRYGT